VERQKREYGRKRGFVKEKSFTKVSNEMASALKPLAGKVALVTGSTSGIGASIARVLGKQGASLVVNGLVKSQAEGESIKKAFEDELGVKVALSTHDLSKASGVEEMISFSKKQLGDVDILVS
jgi:3-hydroxybutyrate dehydrogenase